MAKTTKKSPAKAAKKSAVKAKSVKKAPKAKVKSAPKKVAKKAVKKTVVAKKVAPKKEVAKKVAAKPTEVKRIMSTPASRKQEAMALPKIAPQLNIFPALTQRPIAHKSTKQSSTPDDKTRYSDDELKDFEKLINGKLAKARDQTWQPSA